MTIDGTELCEIATINELREWKKVPLDATFLRALDGILSEIYEALRPKQIHYEQRSMLVAVFNKMVTKIFGKNGGFPLVEEFGSFKMDLFTAESDLDLSVNFSDSTSGISTEFPRAKRIHALRKLSKILYAHQKQGHVRGVLPIMGARVPVLKAVDCGTGVECDISVENKDGISRSAIISLVSSIDERFQILSYLMKMWAKANDINSSKDRTMSSMAIIALVAFHLQTVALERFLGAFGLFFPRWIPRHSYSIIMFGQSDGTSISNIEKNVHHFKNFGRGNKESIAELFISLICKLTAVENLWDEGLCASMYEGTWVYKTRENSSRKVAGMSVEDFLDRSENFARTVGKKAEMEEIKKCTQKALKHLIHFLSGQIDSNKLKARLFGPAFSTPLPIANPQDNNYTNERLTWEDIPVAPPIEREEVPNKKRKSSSSRKATNAKRSRYDPVPARQEPPPIYEEWYHQGPAFGSYFTGYGQIQYPIPDPRLGQASSANSWGPHLDYGQNVINPSGPGFMMPPPPLYSHGTGTLPTSNFPYRYRQPDLMYQYGRGFMK